MRSKVLQRLSILLVIMLIVAGCGSAQQPPSTGENPEPGSEKPSGKRVLVVYSSNNPEVNTPVMKEFQERTGIEVQLITAPGGELVKRIEAEAENPQADVLYGGGREIHETLQEFFQPYVTSENDAIITDFLYPDSISTPQFVFPQVIMYNKDLVSEDEVPQGWADLLDPKWKGKIALADPAASSSSYAQLVTMLIAFGRDDGGGWDFVKALMDNIDGKMLSGSTMVHKGVADNEFYFGITPEDNPLRYIQNGANVGIIYPVEGTSLRSDGNSILKGAKNLDEAKMFMDFIASKDVHLLGQREFLRRSTRNDIPPLEGSIATEDIAANPFDAQWASDNKDDVLERFHRIVTGQD